MLENDTPEQRARDEDVIEWYEQVHGPSEAETITHAARCRQRLRSLKRVTIGDNLMDRG